MRDGLSPRRLTIVMWDQAFLLRHDQGCSCQDYDRVLDETVARAYNTVRIDPMAQLLDLTHLERVNTWDDPQTPYMPWGWTPPTTASRSSQTGRISAGTGG